MIEIGPGRFYKNKKIRHEDQGVERNCETSFSGEKWSWESVKYAY